MRVRFNISICVLTVLIMAVTALGITGCSDDGVKKSESTPETTISEEVNEYELVKSAVKDYLKNQVPNIKASDLERSISDGNPPYIVSLRSAEDYAKGHIPGAVNLKFSELTTLPEDRDILVYCYTGQTSSFASAVLGVLGYRVQNLLHGMSAWTTDPDVYVSRFEAASVSVDYPVDTKSPDLQMYVYPELDNTGSTDKSDILEAAAKTVAPKYIKATDLNSKISEGEVMTILDLRSAEDYAAGHIPGAIRSDMNGLIDCLSNLNPGAPVYVYCYTGHSSAQTAALLQMLGYDAYSLMFGMCGWSSDPSVNAGNCFDPDSVSSYR